MEPLFAVLVGLLFAGGVYLVLEGNRVRTILGVVLLGNAANLLILVAGRITPGAVPLIPEGLAGPAGPIANPLAQALVLTAIVIGLALAVFALSLLTTIPDSEDRQD
jgi:multicomponent Na+:H+ antiporter subunit C